LAPGTTAPLASFTVPEIDPRSDWENREIGNASNNIQRRNMLGLPQDVGYMIYAFGSMQKENVPPRIILKAVIDNSGVY
jgi:hypothetical protein